MKNKKLFNAIVRISLVSMVLAMSFQLTPVRAAALSDISDTMSRLKASTASNHTIQFVTPTGVEASTDTITLTFSADFTMGAVAFGDIDLAEDNDGSCNGPWTDKTLAAAAGAGTWGAVVAGQVVTLTAPTDAAVGEIDAGYCVQIQIGTNASGGSNQITNGALDDDDTVTIGGLFGDSGSLVVDIIGDDQVQVTATVDPTFTFTLTGNDCNLGSLTPTTYDACIVVSTVSTNANSGYTATLLDDNALGLRSAGGDSISDVLASTNIDSTSVVEQFGISTEDSGVAIDEYTTNGGEIDPAQCGLNLSGSLGPFDPITTTEQIYASNAAPITSDEVELCIAAHSIATTEAGIYNDTLTFIATGTF